MSGALVLDLTVPLDRFTLAVRWETQEASLGIFGPSGAGKTTILEALAGLRSAARGLIRMNGRTWLDSAHGFSLPAEKRGVGYVPQEALLFPHRDVMGNLLAGRRRAAASEAPRPEPAKVLEILELSGLEGRAIASLSGGEKKRVALGRALCSGPDLLLLDEPLAGLDLPLRRRILTSLLRIRAEFGIPTLHVSHDPTEMTALGGEVLVLAAGRAIARGRPGAVLTDPAVFPMARAEGFENVLRGRVVEMAESSAALEIEPGLRILVPSGGLAPGREALVGLRAEDVILAIHPPQGLSAQNILAGTIREIRAPRGGEESEARSGERGDGQVQVIVGLGRAQTPVVVAITTRALRLLALEPGRPVHLVWKTQSCRVVASI